MKIGLYSAGLGSQWECPVQIERVDSLQGPVRNMLLPAFRLAEGTYQCSGQTRRRPRFEFLSRNSLYDAGFGQTRRRGEEALPPHFVH
jgi:hypothetical protein